MNNTNKVKDDQYKRTPKTLTVVSAVNVTANMRRVTLTGDALKSFPANSEGAVIKMLFEVPGVDKPSTRTYTLANQRSSPDEIDVDFMIHNHNDLCLAVTANDTTHGIGVPWSLHTKAGDEVSFFGPGPVRFINLDADYFLLAADMTGLPALKANLKLLPDNARGKVFIEILSEDDKQHLKTPANIELTWIINNNPGSDESLLFHAIKKVESQSGQIAVWTACEFKTMKKIRHYFKVDLGIEKTYLYISSYWKKGNTEDEHKLVRKADKEA